MAVKRDLSHILRAWKESPRRKPLVLTGARQVGKTWSLKSFARSAYEDHLYLNFEEDPSLDGLFEARLAPSTVIRNIELYTGRSFREESFLLILDEIQVSNRALNSLKYFAEYAPEIHIAAAGSLLGLKLSGPSSFPVGKVDLVELRPLSFLEFLDANEESGLRGLIEEKQDLAPFPEPLHSKLVERLKEYYFVGGMPEAVAAHVETRDLAEVRRLQSNILRTFQLDFARYAAPRDIPKLSLIWESIPVHLAKENKRFVFSAVRPGARSREYENALTWLADAGLILKASRVSKAGVPLAAYARADVFKAYLLDVGLLCAMTRLPASILVERGRLFEEFRGALAENYVAQQLVQSADGALYYWASTGGRAELDFLQEHEGAVFPLEVKAGVNPRSKSLSSFDKQFSPPLLSRTNLLNMTLNGRIANYPLYAVSRFPGLSVGGVLEEPGG